MSNRESSSSPEILNFRTKPFLFYPVILFLFVFLFDKIFFLDKVRDYVKAEYTYIYYDVKQQLLEDLIEKFGSASKNKPEKKLVVLLGSSRLLYFKYDEIQDYYPDWEVYNFSSAVTTPAYYLYFLERMIEGGVKPDFLVLEADPFQFNLNSTTFKKSNLANSFDLRFILSHSWALGKDNVTYFLANKFFGVSRNKPYIANVINRITNTSKYETAELIKQLTVSTLFSNKGNALSPAGGFVEKDFGKLEDSSIRTIGWIYPNYVMSPMQFNFYEKILKLIKQEQISTLVVRPEVSSPLEDLLSDLDIPKPWWEKIRPINESYSIPIVDMAETPDYDCNTFADSGHMAVDCYRPFLRFLRMRYPNP
ncbi:hypothetical protein CH373_07345 [Leptospira perolatii]|uniref:DUF1574 domain-containing protein n=1 Tax=Leptospira perolatii TaxID=2023191 RepID=A0A2M9ZPD4_9LEPT|nr:DUF1574 domain-containing protein [Leptospira perolatii]PJZ70730.1 hypothetical protein CH360_04205 [Leptospira perolatii]PJZ73938.1 hypothetical protein CH373_07345 [Leptospira perolatii]